MKKILLWARTHLLRLISATLVAVISSFVVIYINMLIGIKDKNIDELKKEIVSLKNETGVRNESLDNLSDGIDKMEASLSSYPSAKPEIQKETIQQYLKILRRHKPVQLYLESTSRDLIISPPYKKYSDMVEESQMLDSMYSACYLYTYHLWFSEKEIYNLPRPALIGLAQYFNEIERYCYKVPENINRIREDKWYGEYMFYFTDTLVFDTDRIKEKYDDILNSARKLEKIMIDEKSRL